MISFNTAPKRLSLAGLLAAPLVYGLFLGASWLIQVDEIVLVEGEQRQLGMITPQKPTTLEPREDRTAPEMEAAIKPPPPPRPTPPRPDTSGFVTVWSGGEPPVPVPSGLRPLIGATSPVQGRNLTPVRAPRPSIPVAAIQRGVSGTCDVVFDVDTSGRPQNVIATCTDEIFRAEAERSVRRAEFLPAIRHGQPVEQTGAVYPLEFRVQ
jgi:periplasmic protein TonB